MKGGVCDCTAALWMVISGAVRSVFQFTSMQNHASHTCQRAAPGNLQKPLGNVMILHAPSNGGSYLFRENLTFSPKTFKNIVKMNIFIVRSCAGPSPARSGPRLRSRIPRGGLQKTLEILVFLRCRPWNSTGGPSPRDADLTVPVKTLLFLSNPYKSFSKWTFLQ